jgi:hypothetical protein
VPTGENAIFPFYDNSCVFISAGGKITYTLAPKLKIIISVKNQTTLRVARRALYTAIY